MPLKYDTSHMIVLKSVIETLLGEDAWYELKETTSLTPWKNNFLILLKAIRISIQESIEVRDQEWFDDVIKNIKEGEDLVKKSADFDEMLACFTAILLKQVFLQIGAIPKHNDSSRVSLKRDNWKLNKFRSVQYVQSKEQMEAVFLNKQLKEIGRDKQITLKSEYLRSKSSLLYSMWCTQYVVV